MNKVLITFKTDKEQKEIIEHKLKDKVDIIFMDVVEPDKIKDVVQNVNILLVLRWNHIMNLIPYMPNIKIIQSMSAGVDHVPFDILKDNIEVYGNAGAYSEPIAEHTFAFILYFAKNIGYNMENMKNGIFDQYSYSMELRDKKIAIIGYGGIGKAIGKIAKSFGMYVYGINRTGNINDEIITKGYSIKDIDKIFPEMDVVVLSLPLSKTTYEIIDKTKLSFLKKNCILINVGRGAVIKEEDLYDFLISHPDVKFGTDVWWSYTDKNDKFRSEYNFFELKNFIGSPHNSSMVPGIFNRALGRAVDNIVRYLNNEKLVGVINRTEYSNFNLKDRSAMNIKM
ncbi:MAG: 2-hydroxyacid dehydrogenase [Candidatus Thermoplasmatota archaeon]|nr:2-hydroxyacid dehydrogenase [Candidatus Thermoplasmatota archaeon]MCL5963515.1 2-hydroxyacid dehydrogenase [Candidatus Thermoplasmatota archaeon]